ncbi:HD-GYP domain-containing protein [Natroniella sulfidigena]|uniref:HD-GYP domain-containing protein n=1 Tax=Natroniella sulfidigena TaxID=723921 RepID=UPI002009FDB8|nr:HD-GYP domain-containing protein [Natroniella sulfidigena]MCK8817451.1 HD-GYP domain-containing protein [Natroniella sulfidigena]
MNKMKSENKIILIYLLFGLGWILFSDRLLVMLVTDQEIINYLQSIKGSLYVILTGIIFYYLMHQPFEKLRTNQKELEIKTEELQAKYKEIKEYNHEITALNQELETSYKEMDRVVKDLEKLINLISILDNSLIKEKDKFLSKLFNIAFELVPEADYGAAYLYEEGYVKFLSTIGHDLSKLKETPVRKEVFTDNNQEIIITENLKEFLFQDLVLELNENLKKGLRPIKKTIILNLTYEDIEVGGINLDISEDNNQDFSLKTKKILQALKSLATAFFNIQKHNKLQQNFQQEIIISFAQMLELHDDYTKNHSQNVANIAAKIAKVMDLSSRVVDQVYWTGLIHDIGKTIVPKHILNKKGSLTDQEYELVKKHPYWGYLTLSNSEELKEIATYVLSHHERWDGKGYPNGLEEEQIPLVSQIVSIADAWDAMRTNRSYREKLTKKEAIQEIKSNQGQQFSPTVTKTFLEIIDQFDQIHS